jgi:hypothetical protein
MGFWPQMKQARPAVQLYREQWSVKAAPSFATRSMLGVRYPIIVYLPCKAGVYLKIAKSAVTTLFPGDNDLCVGGR